jgi:hypothetical protein
MARKRKSGKKGLAHHIASFKKEKKHRKGMKHSKKHSKK